VAKRMLRDLRVRKNFARIDTIIDIPDLINIQRNSYEEFLQANLSPEKREDIGLQAIYKSVFPIKDFNQTAQLEFVSYTLDPPKYDVGECRARGMTYASPVRVSIRLVTWDKDEEGNQSIRDMKEQEVYFGEIPLMTEHGTFIVNGTERVIVSQLHRSPGVFFDHDRGKTLTSGKLLFSARVIPYRGSWLDFEFDRKDLLFVRIDRRRKMHVTVLLRALGYAPEELLNEYYDTEVIRISKDGKVIRVINYDLIQGQKATRDIVADDGKVVVRQGKKFGRAVLRKMRDSGITEIEMHAEELIGKVVARDIINFETGEVLFDCNAELEEGCLETLVGAAVEEFQTLFIDPITAGPYLRDTLAADKTTTEDEAVLEIYRRLRPGDPSTVQQARTYFENLFFNPSRYDLSEVGRVKLNHKLHRHDPVEGTVLAQKDLVEVIRYLLALRNSKANFQTDDIDHLGNRRVRAVGELMENQYRIGLVRMERAIKERMTMSQELETLMPHDLINAKPVSAVVKEYFGSSQLSQFMDQTNPLSEVTHKRRLSALGPGGLTRDRAGFEVRDVHTTHYGRVCPIETPEGPNIGLIASLATYARVNRLGFIETPYRTVEENRVTSQVRYYTALQEEDQVIAQANAAFDKEGNFTEERVPARVRGEFQLVDPSELTLMDVSPNQLVSVAASLVPFLEHDDANRALMGSNMMRQAVPLLRTSAPLVATALEPVVAADSGVTVVARNNGLIEYVDAERIVVRPDALDTDIDAKPDIYNLVKYKRSNQNTCSNQKPIVAQGDRVTAGTVIADGPATELGELALGRNVIVAFMPWGGYNFEDSILISEKVVKEDLYTSVHIEEFECTARDTKLGKEEITRDIPNVGEEAMASLDDAGIVRIGAEVTTRDILVGKITPKGETQLSPEEKLLRAIFGEKAGDVRDTSLRVPPGVKGTVIDARVFSRKGVEKDSRTIAIEEAEEARLLKDCRDESKIMRTAAYDRIARLLDGHTTAAKLVSDKGDVLIGKGKPIAEALLKDIPQKYWTQIQIADGIELEATVTQIANALEASLEKTHTYFDEKIKRMKKGDELPPGVIKMVKVSVAIKRKLQVGDKMAGRHGNKGVISRILPEEDLPYLPDGTPVDVVLNPLGVPSRMNIGQILETHLGWAALGLGNQIGRMAEIAAKPEAIRKRLLDVYDSQASKEVVESLGDEDVIRLAKMVAKGVHMATPAFDGCREDQLLELLKSANRNPNGQTVLFDGRSGEAFDEDVTVGVMYVLKLHHLVDDKIHARSIGPYSLVTQQPLGGKAQFGGQRLGEMEVWALEAYGAAYALQEFLTVKSDDVVGRTRIYEAIVKGDHNLEPGLPESFKVLLKELKSLALDVELIEAS
jgi:DNA-directed RNA polymerase subunit beta